MAKLHRLKSFQVNYPEREESFKMVGCSLQSSNLILVSATSLVSENIQLPSGRQAKRILTYELITSVSVICILKHAHNKNLEIKMKDKVVHLIKHANINLIIIQDLIPRQHQKLLIGIPKSNPRWLLKTINSSNLFNSKCKGLNQWKIFNTILRAKRVLKTKMPGQM